MLIAGGAIIIIGALTLALSGGSDSGSSFSGSKATSYVSPTGSNVTAPAHTSLSNPPKREAVPYKKITNENVSTSVESLIDCIKTSKWHNENNPGIDICNFNNGNAQCQSAAVLQSIVNIQKANLEYRFGNLIDELRKQNNNVVSINNFVTDFSNNTFIDEKNNNNPLHSQLETFITGKTTSKNSNGFGVATAKTSPKTASATDYMTALMSLFDIRDEKYCIRYHKKLPGNGGYQSALMPAVISLNLDKQDRKKLGEDGTTLYKLIENTLSVDKSFSGVLSNPDYLFLSTESLLPAETLYILRNYIENNTVNLFHEDFRIKSMVCRKTSKNLLTEGDLTKINTSGGTHFVCVSNDNRNKKFIEIDSSHPGQIKSCSNNDIINFIRDDNGSYNIPVIVIFEKKSREYNNPIANHPTVDDNILPKVVAPKPTEGNNKQQKDWNIVTKAVENDVIRIFDDERQRLWPFEKGNDNYNKQIFTTVNNAKKEFSDKYEFLLKNVPNNLSDVDKKKWLKDNATNEMRNIMKKIGL